MFIKQLKMTLDDNEEEKVQLNQDLESNEK
jgi:hypothetical protein